MHFLAIVEEMISILTKSIPAAVALGGIFAIFKQIADKRLESRSAELKLIKEEQPEFFRKVRNQSIELLER